MHKNRAIRSKQSPIFLLSRSKHPVRQPTPQKRRTCGVIVLVVIGGDVTLHNVEFSSSVGHVRLLAFLLRVGANLSVYNFIYSRV